ncbi:OLC1v1010044C2 [Oldenlandia corymbosa var. corymbosa]|uniref:OLC1v1010044C2 n=1 Tax=Oldenlandia corymbosa var. corymbosa TaxID=529605 RepID=A0AAV1DT19_OLDCO|nr:OLC1v1010044C2 [Oldenlandia corymbosa var. corymbosa]
MAFSFTQPQNQTSSIFQTPLQQPQSNLFSFNQNTQPQTQSSPFQWQSQAQQPQQQPQQQQQQLGFPQAQPQAQQQNQQQQLLLLTNDKVPVSYGTKWADLHPDSQKFLLQIEERVLEYRDESQRLDQCSRLYDSSVLNGGFELDASRVFQELGGISSTMDRHKAICQELMAVAKDMLRNTEVAVRSFMMLRPRFLHSSVDNETIANASTPGSGVLVAQTSTNQPAATSIVPVFDFYSGIPKKPSPFLQQTVIRFEKQISECRQWIEELEQLILLDADRDSLNSTSSLLQSLPKVMANVHEFFVHVAAKVESIHQYIESMKTAYLADQRRRGDGNDPFLEADRRETAKQEAAARRVHPTLHLPAPPQSSTQVAGSSSSSVGVGALATQPTTTAFTSASLLSTPSSVAFSSSMFSTPATSASQSVFGQSAISPQPSLFGTLSSSTPAFGASTFSTPPATGPATGLGSSFTSSVSSSLLYRKLCM